MLKNISSTRQLSDTEYWSKVIKERNKFILDNKYSVIDCGI